MHPNQSFIQTVRPRARQQSRRLPLAVRLPFGAWLRLAAVLASLALAAPGAAQSPAAAGDAGSVEELLERGVELRRNGRDTEALALFWRVLELDPDSSRARSHLGTTYQALGRWVLAEVHLTQALAKNGDSYIERHRPALDQALGYVKEHLGSLEVSGGPPGAEVQLNGQRIGALPMSEPVRVPVGSYQMEVSLAGHYGINQPIRISSGALRRESVELLPFSAVRQSGRSVAPGAANPASEHGAVSGSGSVEGDSGAVPAWVPWTLAGVSTAAAVVTTAAWLQRERHAERWNDDGRCLNVPGATRQSLCGDERTEGLRAQTIALVSGGLAVAFAAGAVWTALAGSSDAPAEAGLDGCAVGLAAASCAWRF